MSRIGKNPINIPANVKVSIDGQTFHAEGPKGKLQSPIPSGIEAKLENSVLEFSRTSEEGPVRACHGLARALAANCITGVTDGFKKTLHVIGVGYRVNVKPKEVELHLGYSHPINFPLPAGITAESSQERGSKAIVLTIEGADKQAVGQVAANIRRLRKPEPYKGKGIRYADEQILRKAGKSGK